MDSFTPHDLHANASANADVDAAHDDVNIASQLRSRVVREARRETWFVVNEGTEELATVPIETAEGRSIRRVQVNGEVAEFSSSPGLLLVRPRRALRPGAGTIVMIHFR